MAQEFVFGQKCPSCSKNSIIVDSEGSEIFCKNCGVVLDRVQNFDREEYVDYAKNNLRTGPFSTLASFNPLFTVMDYSNVDAFGKKLPSSAQNNFGRLRVWDQRTHSTLKGKNLSRALTELAKIKDKISLPDGIVEDAAYIYRKALDKNLIRGRSILSMIAASVYCGCRKQGVPRTMKEIADIMNIGEKQIASSYRILLNELNLKMPVQDAVYWVFRIASLLEINEKVTRKCIDIIKLAISKRISAGKHPVAIAATALYLAAINEGHDYTQRQIAQAANITEVTIRNRIKNLIPLLKELEDKNHDVS